MDYYSPSTNRGEGKGGEEGRAKVGWVDGCGGRKVYILHVKLCLRDTNVSREQTLGDAWLLLLLLLLLLHFFFLSVP